MKPNSSLVDWEARKTGGDFEADWHGQWTVKCYVWYRTNLNGWVSRCRLSWTAYQRTGRWERQVGILKLIDFGSRGSSVMYDTEPIWMVESAYVDWAEQLISGLGGEKDRWGFWSWLTWAKEGRVLCMIQNKSESLSCWFCFTTLLWIYECPGGDFEAD